MKRIVLAITLYISCMVVDYLVHYLNNRKKSSSPTTTQNSESYVGLFVVIWTSSWKLEVNKTELKIHKLFHRTQSVSVFDIKNVRIGEKQDVTLYDMDDKKVLTVDALSDNYNRFLKTLEFYGKYPAACK